MNKADFVAAVAAKAGLSKADSQRAISAALDVITEALKKGESVSFIGFGTFETVDRPAREARVPGTDKKVKVPATKVVKFRVGKKLKESVGGK
ncbi:MAG: HU family DNA-binding protein [Campylobacterales bacterium]